MDHVRKIFKKIAEIILFLFAFFFNIVLSFSLSNLNKLKHNHMMKKIVNKFLANQKIIIYYYFKF